MKMKKWRKKRMKMTENLILIKYINKYINTYTK